MNLFLIGFCVTIIALGVIGWLVSTQLKSLAECGAVESDCCDTMACILARFVSVTLVALGLFPLVTSLI